MLEIDKIYEGDCLEIMPEIADKSIDMILCDLPYGNIESDWDNELPLSRLWDEYKRVIKDRGAIVLTASQPFTSKIVSSNLAMFKYSWIWEKTRGSGFINSKNAPLKIHEDILVFSKGTTANRSMNNMIYNPQGLIHKEYVHKQNAPMSAKPNGYIKNRPNHKAEYEVKFINYPVSVLHFSNPNNDIQHPTQKPVALFEYLIKTYTNEGDTVLDSCIGSGTTAIAALNTGRHFIGIENEPKYVEIARKRISALPKKLTDFAYKSHDS